MELPNHSSFPDLATWPVFGVIVGLLMAALVLEIVLSPNWSDPFMEPSTWLLIGVAIGFVLRGLGHRRGRRGLRGEKTLRRMSLWVWAMTALGGFVSLLF